MSNLLDIFTWIINHQEQLSKIYKGEDLPDLICELFIHDDDKKSAWLTVYRITTDHQPFYIIDSKHEVLCIYYSDVGVIIKSVADEEVIRAMGGMTITKEVVKELIGIEDEANHFDDIRFYNYTYQEFLDHINNIANTWIDIIPQNETKSATKV